MTDPSAVVWARVDRDFDVASSDGQFWGTVDRQPDGSFVARDMRSTVLGVYPTLDEARAAVTAPAGAEE